MEIRVMQPGEHREVISNGKLFDGTPRAGWTADFLEREGHHLLMAFEEGIGAGFVTGIEMLHPDKGCEMLLYELGVDERYRRRGIGRALVLELVARARRAGCRGMWVPVEDGDQAAVATYRSAGASPPMIADILTWEFEPGPR